MDVAIAAGVAIGSSFNSIQENREGAEESEGGAKLRGRVKAGNFLSFQHDTRFLEVLCCRDGILRQPSDYGWGWDRGCVNLLLKCTLLSSCIQSEAVFSVNSEGVDQEAVMPFCSTLLAKQNKTKQNIHLEDVKVVDQRIWKNGGGAVCS